MTPEPTVFVVDDDEAVRGGLRRLLESVSLNVETYESAQMFLDNYHRERHGCLVLDVRMPGMGGLDLQAQLAKQGIRLPIIILTGHADVPIAVSALKAGAIDLIEKPFNGQMLLDRIQYAIQQDTEARRQSAEKSEIDRRLAQLTPREREVMKMMVDGKASKVIAIDLSISERTVEFHRANIMKKMQARTLAELIQMSHVTARDIADP
jgi:two-component system, LuxR family, response regulator FixJ